jgi:hypothetical protein
MGFFFAIVLDWIQVRFRDLLLDLLTGFCTFMDRPRSILSMMFMIGECVNDRHGLVGTSEVSEAFL